MSQLNMHITTDFEKKLLKFMQLRGITTKSEAIRLAVTEGLEQSLRTTATPDFNHWIGLATRAPLNPNPRFKTDDDIWEEK